MSDPRPDQDPSRSDATSLPSASSEASLLDGSYSAFNGSQASSPIKGDAEIPPSGPFFQLPAVSPPAAGVTDEDEVHFPTSTTHQHATWAKTFHSRPERYFQPKSLEDVQTIVQLARRKRRRLVTVGYGHSPSDLTCTSSWMVNLDRMNKVLKVKKDTNLGEDMGDSQRTETGYLDESGVSIQTGTALSPLRPRKGRALVQAGISLGRLNEEVARHSLTLPSLGSIDVQSVAGAIATGTHGSSVQHGLLSESVRGLRIVLADGRATWCSVDEHPDLFRAALVSLGGLGIITEIEIELVAETNIEWEQTIITLNHFLAHWDEIWSQSEFVRCWWLPYMKRIVVWKASETKKPPRPPKTSYYGGSFGYYVYQNLLWIANYFPRILPTVEWFIFGMEHGFALGSSNGAVVEQRKGLLMDCLYSQFVNEWSLPLSKGPQVLTQLSKWLNGDEAGSGIPFSNKGIWVHAPIEVRAADGTVVAKPGERAFLDTTIRSERTLYLNATLYRPYGLEPPCRERYYEAFEWLMKQNEARPHWAKNFTAVTPQYIRQVYGSDVEKWLGVRKEVDPEGMFAGAWHRKYVLGEYVPVLALEEVEVDQRARRGAGGGVNWLGQQRYAADESFEVIPRHR